MEHAFADHYLTGREVHHGNFVLALIAGFVMAVLCAVIWLAINLITGWHSAFSSLAVAAVVGYSIRLSGQGPYFFYGVLGIVFTLLSCLMGEIGVSLQLATTPFFDFYGVLTHVDIIAMSSAIIGELSPVMALVYGIASFEAYMLSIQK